MKQVNTGIVLKYCTCINLYFSTSCNLWNCSDVRLQLFIIEDYSTSEVSSLWVFQVYLKFYLYKHQMGSNVQQVSTELYSPFWSILYYHPHRHVDHTVQYDMGYPMWIFNTVDSPRILIIDHSTFICL